MYHCTSAVASAVNFQPFWHPVHLYPAFPKGYYIKDKHDIDQYWKKENIYNFYLTISKITSGCWAVPVCERVISHLTAASARLWLQKPMDLNVGANM